MTLSNNFKVVIFDFGGVLMSYDNYVQGWKDAEDALNLPNGSIHSIFHSILTEVPNIDRQMFEGHLSAEEIEEEILPSFLSRKLGVEFPRPFPALHYWQGPGNRVRYNEKMVEAVRNLRKLGYRTALMTNNFKFNKENTTTRVPVDLALFDYVFESAVEGIMKPDREFYERVQSGLPSDVAPHHCVFLDDMKANCEAGERFGWTCVQVNPKDVSPSIEELEGLLGTRLF